MTENQVKCLDTMEKYFAVNNDKEWVSLNELNSWAGTRIQPATVISLVKKELLKVQKEKRMNVYQMGDMTTIEEALRFQEEDRESMCNGILVHLDNSKSKWIKQCEELGIEFPETEWEQWAEKIRAQVSLKQNSTSTTGMVWGEF